MGARVARDVGLGLAAALTASVASAAGPASAHYARGIDGVFWFLHISDSHIGTDAIQGPHASEHLQFALQDAVDVVDPVFVVNTGDLQDGSRMHVPALGQDQAQWDAYKQICSQAGMDASFYYDLPGNHDGYDDIGLSFYLGNSIQGQATAKPYTSWVVDTTVGQYYFFGLNTAGNGSQSFVEAPAFTDEEILALDTGLQQHPDAELSFALGHHRIDTPTNNATVIGLLTASDVGFYLHGHVHEYSEYLSGGGSIVSNEVDTLGKSNNDNVAVGVVDHNAFVYRAKDVTATWPFVMITAPVSQKLRGEAEDNPYAYTVCRDRTDNPVRAAVFSSTPASAVEVEIIGGPTTAMYQAEGSSAIWYALVDTTAVPAGTHSVIVTATAGNDTSQDTILAGFVDGPCDDLPGQDPPPSAGGAGGAGGAGAGGMGAGGVGASGGSGGNGATGALGGGGAAGADQPPTPGGTDAAIAVGGCGCRFARSHSPMPAPSLLLGLGATMALGRIRRRRAAAET
jgi:hypothetical protein